MTMSRDLVTESDFQVFLRELQGHPAETRLAQAEERTEGAFSALARSVNRTTRRFGYFAGLSQLIYLIARDRPLTHRNEEFAAFLLSYLAEETRLGFNFTGGRDVPDWLQRLFAAEVLEPSAVDTALDQNRLVRAGDFMPDPGVTADGLKVEVALGFAGLDQQEQERGRRLARFISDLLRGYGMVVEEPVDHHDDSRAHAVCNLRGEFDLLTILGAFPGTRVGHQTGRAGGLLTPVLVLKPRGASMTCLFDSEEAGEFRLYEYDSPEDIPRLIQEFLREELPLLRAHELLRNSWQPILHDQFIELKTAVHRAESRDELWPLLGLISRKRALNVVSSPHLYAGTSTVIIAIMRDALGLPPLVSKPLRGRSAKESINQLKRLLTQNQRQDLAAASRVVDPSPQELERALTEAVGEMVLSASSQSSLRTVKYDSRPDWVHKLREVRDN